MNWQKIVQEINDSGMTQQQMADFCGCTQSAIADIKSGRRGRRMGFEIGRNLQALYEQRILNAELSERLERERDETSEAV